MLLKDEKRKNYLRSIGIEYIDIDCNQLNNIIIETEKKILSNDRIDIFAKIEFKNEVWILAIENKLFSYERDNQTIGYYNELSQKYPKEKKVCVFLNRLGDPAQSEKFMSCSWEEIYSVIKKLGSHQLKSDIKYFLNQFKNSMDVFVMENPRLDELCSKLYNRYEEVFDYLTQWIEKNRAFPHDHLIDDLEKSLKDMLSGDNWWFEKGKNWIIILKKDWYRKQEERAWLRQNTKYFSPFVIYFFINEKEELKLNFYSKGNESEEILRKIKEKFIEEAKLKEKDNFYNTCLNTNIETRSIFLYTIIENIETQDWEFIIQEFNHKIEEILNFYIPIIGNIIKAI